MSSTSRRWHRPRPCWKRRCWKRRCSFVRLAFCSLCKFGMLCGGKTHTAIKARVKARVGCAARSRQRSVEWVSEQRAHSIGSAAAAVLAAPLRAGAKVSRLLTAAPSAISSTMCAASENTASVTIWEELNF